MSRLEGTFVEALARDDTPAAVSALLDLDSAISARVRGGEDSPDLDNATATFRALIARLGERADDGLRDARPLLEPFVETLLELRARARAASDWETADLIRDRLTSAGVEVRDAADDSTWVLSDTPAS
jgi:cysteinyl-tRNA synthetase